MVISVVTEQSCAGQRTYWKYKRRIPEEDSPDMYIPTRTHRNQVTEDSLDIYVGSSSMYLCRGLTGHIYSKEDSPKSRYKGVTGNWRRIRTVAVCRRGLTGHNYSTKDSPKSSDRGQTGNIYCTLYSCWGLTGHVYSNEDSPNSSDRGQRTHWTYVT